MKRARVKTVTNRRRYKMWKRKKMAAIKDVEKQTIEIPITLPELVIAATGLEIGAMSEGGVRVRGNIGLIIVADRGFADRLEDSDAHRATLAGALLRELPVLLQDWLGAEQVLFGLMAAQQAEMEEERARRAQQRDN